MNTYTFRSNLGNYSFSDSQIDSNPYLNSREKEIMHGLAAGQSQVRKSYESTSTERYDYYSDTDNKGRRTLEKRPSKFETWVDFNDKRWYESMSQFLERKRKEYIKKNTVRTKEVKRENINVERSTFGDGTEITKWDKQTRLFY